MSEHDTDVERLDAIGDYIAGIEKENAKLKQENAVLRNGLHRISLASQNSMSSKEECGRIARTALEETER